MKLRIPALLIIGFMFIISGLSAQQDEEPLLEIESRPYPSHFIKFSPLALLELPQPSIQIAFEYGLGWPFYLQHELGWVIPSESVWMFDRGNMQNGAKVKTELRYYLEDEKYLHLNNQRAYIAVEGLYKIRNFQSEEWYQMNSGSFSQWLSMSELKHQIAFHFKIGKSVNLAKSRNVYADSWFGLGLRQYFSTFHYDTKDLAGTPDFLSEPYNYILPSLTMGFKIGFGF